MDFNIQLHSPDHFIYIYNLGTRWTSIFSCTPQTTLYI